MKFANWGFGCLFLLAAVLQWNDPDPWRWLLVYLAAGVVSISANFRPSIWRLAAAVAIVTMLWVLVDLPGVAQDFQFGSLVSSMKAEDPSIEKSRELLGLLIVLAWMIVILLDCRKKESRSEVTTTRPRE